MNKPTSTGVSTQFNIPKQCTNNASRFTSFNLYKTQIQTSLNLPLYTSLDFSDGGKPGSSLVLFFKSLNFGPSL
ncbi:hypothetical protein F511_07268 [Dorcoceras hygrometricum]|uniref:Uncharacterized protein n=1 Tax=Dorcoceras hygrometricum TaxID=472368 RepID=A0A2Z7AU41_9LAMI|nr:hypothetical protein F511_07268 [Dorcoceras hygrometricum]